MASESDFDELAAAAAEVAAAPTAAVSVVSGDGLWIRGRAGITPGVVHWHESLGERAAGEDAEIEWNGPP